MARCIGMMYEEVVRGNTAWLKEGTGKRCKERGNSKRGSVRTTDFNGETREGELCEQHWWDLLQGNPDEYL